ncbi:MAG TPA: sugar nucleotide-binding protein [Candidatus Andersenbacteria bacterium]|nr:sugar nucleotide-binding protein [Candidatus Andersenbacteria bacterium]
MNYFVLGGSGFIGSNVVKLFGATPIIHDLREDPSGRLGDIQKGDIVFHAAHFGPVDECAKNPEVTAAINVAGTKGFFDEIKNRGGFPVYFSTNMVFDGGKAAYTELETPQPITEYGRQKHDVEKYIMSLFSNYLIIRMTKVYGEGSEAFIDSWIDLLKDGKHIRAAEDMYAAPVFVADVITSLQDVLNTTYSGVCHIGGPHERRMDEIAELVARHMGSGMSSIERIRLQDLELVEKRSVHNSLACDTLKKQGCRIPRDIPEILREFYS